MLINVCKRAKYVWCLIPVGEYDILIKDKKTRDFYNEAKEYETGWDRLTAMFSLDEFGAISPELNAVNQATFVGLFTGACFGGFVRSRVAYMNFVERNQATTFTSHFEAKKKLQDTVTVSFAKGAFQWGWRLGLFSGSYMLLTTAISVYRGKNSILEYAVAGGVTGGMYKISMGTRGVVVGTVLGTVLGCVAGSASLAILYMTGTSMEEVRFWQQGWKRARERAIHEGMKKATDEQNPLLKEHDRRIEAANKKEESVAVQ